MERSFRLDRSRALRAAFCFTACSLLAFGCAASAPTAAPQPTKVAVATIPDGGDSGAHPAHAVDRELACNGSKALRDMEQMRREMQSSAQDATPESDDTGMYEYRVTSPDRCGVAKNNVDASMKAILAAPPPATPRASARPNAPWSAGAPQRLSLVQNRFRLTSAELLALRKNGFFASDRLEVDSYGAAFHDVFQSELPVFVSMDALFNAVYAAHDGLLAEFEEGRLMPALQEMLGRMACTLPDAAPDYGDETANDVDLYLTVARSLLGMADKSVLGASDEQAAALAQLAQDATQFRGIGGEDAVVMFGRPRAIDFTQYTPRGHYATHFTLGGYFRASMWLSRLEFNLVSRSCRSSHPSTGPDPSETPREELAALALADLVERSGATPMLELLDKSWALFAGVREDVGMKDLVALRKNAGITSLRDPDAPAKLRAAIGDGFRRTARLHYMPEGAPELPAIATMLGPRVVPDAAAMRPLVNDAVPNRFMVGPGDVGYMLGHDRAKAYLARDLAAFPTLPRALDDARAIAAKKPATNDLYSTWFAAVRAVADDQGPGTFPSFTRTDAYRDMKMDTAITAYGEIRHNYVLLAGQPYDAYGCEIPDGYVEPAPKVLDALVAYAKSGEDAMRVLDPLSMGAGGAYFAKLGRIASVLRRIVERELSGEPLTAEEKRFLGVIAEYLPFDPGCVDSCAPPHYSGWWFDLFPKRKDGLLEPAFIADYYTSSNLGQAAYIGARKPVMGVFVVEQNGPPRVFVGPVARGFGQPGPISPRLGDADALSLPKVDAPWLASYVVKSPEEPPLLIEAARPPGTNGVTWSIDVTSTKELGPVTVTLLDHHRRALKSATRRVGTQKVTLAIAVPRGTDVTGLFVSVGGADFAWTPPQEKEIWNGLTFALGDMRQVLAAKRAAEQN
jgi:hypothetical protein